MTADGALAERLRHPRYEVLPLEGIEAAVRAHVPTEVTVTVTASPRRGLDATIELSERLARQGYAVVPHLSARLEALPLDAKDLNLGDADGTSRGTTDSDASLRDEFANRRRLQRE